MESKTQSENDVMSDAFLNKGVGVRAVVGITCSLSIMGAALVILSYIWFKSVRSKARELLVHLSLMDFGVAVANLVGVAFYLDRFYSDTVPTKNVILPASINATDSDQSPKDVIQNLCTAQAFFSIYFTLGSVLWTLSLALYLYFALVHYKNQQARYFLWLAYAVCWVLPFFLTLWLVLTDRLGYSPYNSSGWCSLVLTDPVTLRNDIFVAIFGYDLWIYTAMILVLILYLAVKAFLKIQFEKTKDFVTEKRFWEAVYVLDYRFLLIPLAFIILRVWSCLINILYVYADVGNRVPTGVTVTLIYLSGIGDSGQGCINAIIFIVLTKPVRDTFLNAFCCCFRRKEKRISISDNGEKNLGSSAERTPLQASSEIRMGELSYSNP